MDTGNISEIAQGIAAVIGIALTIALTVQTRKIKTLTDVVDSLSGIVTELANQTKELANQTQILSASYKLQSELTIRERLPLFKLNDLVATYFPPNRFNFVIQNHGQKVHNVRFAKGEHCKATITNVSKGQSPYAAGPQLWTVELETHDQTSNFEVVMTYNTDNSEVYQQTITSIQRQLKLSFMTEIKV